jgi:3-oxoadipate enol-lactonase
MARHYLQAGGRTIAYIDSAPGAGPRETLVLAHAFPLAAQMWEPQLRAMPEGWRLIAVDLRGFGGSTEPESGDDAPPPSLDDYADDMIDLIAGLEIESPVIGGLSMGGYVALAVMRREAELARALVLADTRAGADTSEGRAARRGMLALLDREGPQGVALEMMPKLLGKTTIETNPDATETVRRLIKGQSPAAIRGAILRLKDRPDATAGLAAIDVPTLIIVGEEDVLTPPAESELLARSIPSALLVTIARAGHLSNLERPEAFNASLGAFLQELS